MLELKNNIFYVGVKDPTLRTFDIFMETEYGTTYNAYLVKGEKTALIETAHEKLLDSYISNIESIKSFSELCFGHYDKNTQMIAKQMFMGQNALRKG